MEITRQMLFLLGSYFMGDILHKVFHVPLPGIVLGMIILFILLWTKAIKLSQVEKVGETLISYIQLFFIPPGVAFMVYYSTILPEIFRFFLVVMLSGILTFAATAWTVQGMISLSEKRKGGKA